MRKHYVTFYSPGTMFAETTSKEIAEWDPRVAVGMAETIKERHGSVPYGFEFSTVLTSKPVPDGEGGTLEVQPKTVATSGRYFIGGELETIDRIEARNLPNEDILRGNMVGNRNPIVVVVRRRWLSTNVFDEKDFTVDASGAIVERGDDPKWVAYRAERIALDEKVRG